MQKIAIYFFVILFMPCFLFAQEQQYVSGFVIDKQSGEPIPGASIIIKGTTVGTTTDFEGLYTLNKAKIGDIIVVAYIGFRTQEKTIESFNSIDFTLEEDVETLDEIVVTGYGSQRKRDITGAVAVVGAEQIDEINPIKIEQALQGTVAGVNISTQSGSPGAGLNIRIRGISTNGDASPVAIIDGYQGDLGTLNPADIETITVLKDAQAAIYGTIGANGIILITTKRGRKNTAAKVEIESSIGWQETSRTLPVLNAREYGILLNEAFTNDGRFPPISNVSALDEGTDWQDELFQTAPIQRNIISLSGGSETINYSFGASTLNQQGIVGLDKSGFNRQTLRSNIGIDLSKKLTFNTSLIFTHIERKSINDFGLGSVLFNAINMPSTIPVYNEQEEYTLAPSNLGIEIINPLAQVANTYNRYKLNKLNGSFGFTYNPFDGLSITSRVGFNTAFSKGRDFSQEINYGGKVFDVTRSTVNQNSINDNDYTFDTFASYKKDLYNHHFELTAGTTVFKTWGNGLFATGYDIPNNVWENADISLANGLNTQKATDSYSYDQRRLSFFGRLQYDYNEKAYVSALIRRDSSTKFGPQNRVGIFPSFSAGYILSEEELLANSDFVDFLKLRFSYGLLGSDKIGDFLYLSQLNGEGVYVFDDELSIGRAVGIVPNSAIKWEESEQLDIGLDFIFMQRKLNLTADYFVKTTNDLLIGFIPVSGILGTNAPGSGSPTVNAGEVVNKGFEFMLSYKDYFGDNFSISAAINATTLENEVTKVNNNTGFIEEGEFGVGQLAPARMQVGFPIGYFYGYQTDGVFQNRAETILHPSQLALGATASPGDFRYKDLNEDDIIDENDRTYLGDPIPDYTFGFNLGLNYKNFDFSLYTFASLGQEMIRNYERVQVYANRLDYYIERWRGEDTSNSVPRLTTKPTANNVFSDFFIEDASFIRLQNIQLGYTLPTKFTETIKIDRLRLYITAENLLTLTNYKGYDPAASNGSPIGSGIDNGFYPIPKTITAGLNLKF